MKDNHQNMAPWDEGFYQTGTVMPPRQRGGLVMVLLVAVVLLGGAVTIMGLLNIRLFVALKRQEKEALHIQKAQTDAAEPVLANSSPDFEMVLSPAQEASTDCSNALVHISCDDVTVSGVVMHHSGYIVTNRHAVVGADSISVSLSDSREFPATLIACDAMTDLAVLYIEAGDLTPAIFGDSRSLQVGDTVRAMASCGSLESGTVHTINDSEIGTDAHTYSGGPLLDRYGRVVGIGTRNSLQVLPTATVKTVVEQLIHQGFVSGRPGLGIQCEPISQRYQSYYDLPSGLYVSQVTGSGPLESGDILLAVDGHPLSDSAALDLLLCGYQVGDQVEVTVLRDEVPITLKATIQSTP